ncbi:hypothetical protein [Azohydromonas lata]|uniref:hypothetical protein n=1 Tax=Azohydromonas lata TaxID=45677 RepID=UPI0012F4B69E|nr:hypothetical protein [Azohydromonas lata]
MSLDAHASRLAKLGTVTIHPKAEGGVQIVAEGFEGENCSCRDIAVLACMWAIGELQREVMRTIEAPGGSAIGVD